VAPATTLVVGSAVAVAGFGFGTGTDAVGCEPCLAAGAFAPGAVAAVAVCFAAGCFVAGVVAGAVVAVAGGGEAKTGGCAFCASAAGAAKPAASANTLKHNKDSRLFRTAFCTVSFLTMIWLRAKEQKHRTPSNGFAGAQTAPQKRNKKSRLTPAFL
jgi:hypothetical protein